MLGKIAYLVNSTYTDYENNDSIINFQSTDVGIEDSGNYDFSQNNEALNEITEKDYFINSKTDVSDYENKFSFGVDGVNSAVSDKKKKIDGYGLNDFFTREIMDDIVSKIDDELGELSLMRERGR